MSPFLKILIFSLFLPFCHPTIFNFNTTVTCQDYHQLWCYKIYYLEADFRNHNILGVSQLKCNDTGTSYEDNFQGNDTSDGWTNTFEIVVVVRHNCSVRPYIRDFRVNSVDVSVDEKEVPIVTNVKLNNNGTQISANVNLLKWGADLVCRIY